MGELLILPGETLTDAIQRISRDKAKFEASNGAASTTVNPGVTKSSLPATQPKPTRAKTTKTKEGSGLATTHGGDPNSGVEIQPQVFSAIHFYQRPGTSEQKVKYEARMERDMHGPNTFVFAHCHEFGGECSRDCKAQVGAQCN